MLRKLLFSAAFFLGIVAQGAAQSIGLWQTVTFSNNPTARHECSYVAVGSKFYLVGGRGTKPTQVYDPVANSWTTEATPPVQLHHFQAIQYNGKIYAVCAFTGNCCHETGVANIYIYDPVTKAWSTGPIIPAARRRGAAGCVVYNNKFYVVCGIIDGHSSGWVSWLDMFDPQTNTWTQLSDAPHARDHFAAVLVNGKIYCMGGRRSGVNGDIFKTTTPEVDIYDIVGNTWSTLPSSLNIPTQRAAPSVAVLGDEILVIGGEGASIAHNQTEAFNVVTQTWRTLSPLVQARHATAAIVYNNEVYIACGSGVRGGGQELNTQEKFSFSSSPPPGGCVPNEVVSFTLVHAGTAGDIGPLTDGMTINLATIGSFSIRANKCQNSGSVKFILNGSTVRTESGAPYTINGDNDGNYFAWSPAVGSKTLTATPYTGSGGSGSIGISKTVSFTVVNQGGGGTPDCNGVAGGLAFLDDCGVCSGGNTSHTANSDKDACGVCFGNGSSCGGTCVPLQVVSFTLVKAGTAGEIGTLTEGMTIGLATAGSFSIRANICPGSTSVKSVKFVLNGSTFRIESTAPYALNGDNPTGSYTKWNASAGSYTLVATPYSGAGGSGTAGVSLTRHFTVVNGAAKTEPSADSNENFTEKTFKIYPNPSSGRFTLAWGALEQNDLNIRIYNQLGQIIFSDTKLLDSGESKEQIVLNNQPTGIYFLQLTSVSKVFNEKLIIRN